VAAFYALLGGRVYCSWVCPVNPVTDGAAWLRRRLGISRGAMLTPQLRYWLLAATFIGAAVSGIILWEAINPVSMLHRGLIFGAGFAWLVIVAVFLFDLLVAPRGWCGHVCPVGAFYGLLVAGALVRMRAPRREQCNNCMDCYAVCPEPQVLKPVLKGGDKGIRPTILDAACTACGRCADVCSRQVFEYGTRLTDRRGLAAAGAVTVHELPGRHAERALLGVSAQR
jgi:ferredoxin-type protein NapH